MSKFIKFIVVIAFIFYGYCFYAYFNTPVTTEIVRGTSIEDHINTTSLIARNELLFKSDFNGTLESIAFEGEKVSKAQKVATLYKGKVDLEVSKALENVNERISDISDNSLNQVIFEGDANKIDNQIDDKINELIIHTNSRSYLKVNQIKNEIVNLAQKKEIVLGRTSLSKNTLDSLLSEKTKIESKINLEKTDLFAMESGFYSSNIDGLEALLTKDIATKMTAQDFDKLDKVHLNESSKVVSGGFVAKIVSDYEWYAIVKTDHKKIANIKPYDTINIRFSDYSEKLIETTVIAINTDDKGNSIIVLSGNDFVSNIYSLRKINIDLILNKYEGLKVPTYAIKNINNKKGVYVKIEGLAQFKEIDILYEKDGISIIKENNQDGKSLLLYDEVITKARDLYDGKLIN